MDEDRKKELVISQGQAYGAALEEMKKETAWVEGEADDYAITVLVEKAEGWHIPEDDKQLTWLPPDSDANQHIEVVVRDKRDGRFLPELMVSLRLFDDAGRMVNEMVQPFSWHPLIFHYGVNWLIPARGKYIPEVVIEQPIFGRHDQKEGNRYPARVSVKLDAIEMNPGRKEYGSE